MEKKESRALVDQLQKQIKELKNQLNKLNAEKEAFFSKKDEVSKKIRALIAKVVDQKKVRNKLTDSVKATKVLRTELNAKISLQLKGMSSQRKEKRYGRREREETPEKLKAKIEELNVRLETEVMKFTKEQAINKEIKEIKKKLEKMKKISPVSTISSKELRELKKQADLEHKKIQTVARESQEKHQVILEQSKVIDSLKVEEKKMMALFLAKKEEFTKANNELKQKIREITPLKKELGIVSENKKEDYKRKSQKKLEEKKRDVEEKIKKGEKLTTEDIIAMQGSSNF